MEIWSVLGDYESHRLEITTESFQLIRLLPFVADAANAPYTGFRIGNGELPNGHVDFITAKSCFIHSYWNKATDQFCNDWNGQFSFETPREQHEESQFLN